MSHPINNSSISKTMSSQRFPQYLALNSSNNAQYSTCGQPPVVPPNPTHHGPYANVQYATPNPTIVSSGSAQQFPLLHTSFNNTPISSNVPPVSTCFTNQVSNYKSSFLTPPPPIPSNLVQSINANCTSSYRPFINSSNFQLTQQIPEANRFQQSNIAANTNYQTCQSFAPNMVQHPVIPNVPQISQNVAVVRNMHQTVFHDELPNERQQCNFQNFPPVPSVSPSVPVLPNQIYENTSQMVQYETNRNSPFCETQNMSQNSANSVHAPQSMNILHNQISPVNSNFNTYASYNNGSFSTLPIHGAPASILGHSVPVMKQEITEESKNLDDDLVRRFLTQIKLNSIPERKSSITIAEFRYLLKIALDCLIQLTIRKEALSKLLESDEETWIKKWNEVKELKDKLSKITSQLSNKEMISLVLEKLKKVKKKRRKIRARQDRDKWLKQKNQQDRLELHKKYDQWLETLREKDLQGKREAEMKKEADSILSEVRRKIQEAKRVIEKLKIFQKLRQIRKENAIKKGMFVFSKHDKIFEKKVSELREMMLKQLSEYEDEEKALKVMLETEQEDQLEEEAQWKIKQLQKRQEKKFQNIKECLFGSLEPPLPTDPLYFFWQNYNAGNCDINALVKIRHDWDVFLVLPQSNEGSSIPQQWVAPEPPSSEIWSQAVDKDFNR